MSGELDTYTSYPCHSRRHHRRHHRRQLWRRRERRHLSSTLTDIQRAQRYEIALSRKDWGYAEWSKVVFSDEASILVGEHRGLQNLSRTPDERYHPDVIERRYNNYSEAMFWGCFSYDYKGPCHNYYKETSSGGICFANPHLRRQAT